MSMFGCCCFDVRACFAVVVARCAFGILSAGSVFGSAVWPGGGRSID